MTRSEIMFCHRSSLKEETPLKVRKNLAVSLFTAGLLAGAIAASNAQAFTLFVDNTPPTTNDWSLGASSDHGSFINIFIPNGAGGPVNYSVPTVVKFGDTLTSGATTGSDTFTNVPVAFTFDLADGTVGLPTGPPTSNHFTVSGTLNGSVGFSGGQPNSSTHLTLTSLMDTDTSTSGVTGTDPNDGLPALDLLGVKLGGRIYDIYIDNLQNIPAPGVQTLSISGFVTSAATTVPEPGPSASMAVMVLGTVLMGLRARRRSK